MQRPYATLVSIVVSITACPKAGDNQMQPNSGDGGSNAPLTFGDLEVTNRQIWSQRTVTVTGTLTIKSGGELVLDHADLKFSPRIEDTDTFAMEGTAKLTATASKIESGSGRQWNLQASDSSQIFLDNTLATGHAGLRCFGNTQFTATGAGANVEEVQLHDDVNVRIANGAESYVVLFFAGGTTAALTHGELTSGSALTREFDIPTSPNSTGHLKLENANVIGWQLDLSEESNLTIDHGENIVLALHLKDVKKTIPDDITSNTPRDGGMDFSATPGNPTFSYAMSAITSLNVYATGACDLKFTGKVDVTEPNANNQSRVEFDGPAITLAANLAQTGDQAQMIFNGVTLEESSGAAPSFTVDNSSTMQIINVAATANTRVAAVAGGVVQINGGSGWSPSMFEAIDTTGDGGVYLNGARPK